MAQATAPHAWRIIGDSIRGASHVRADQDNQDAIDWVPESGGALPIILVVADGHGGAKYFRSRKGADTAVSTAIAVLRGFWQQHHQRAAAAIQSILSSSADGEAGELAGPEALAQQLAGYTGSLPARLVRTWADAIIRYHEKHEFTDEEWATLRSKGEGEAQTIVQANPLLAYGATLLTVLIAEHFVLYLQLGDGDILAVSDSGQVSRPLAQDARLLANETTSLCSPKAWQDVRWAVQPLDESPPALILASTDGYANSFRDEAGFRKVGSDLLRLLRTTGIETVSGHLKTWLDQASQDGSGDDVTLGLICRVDALSTPVGDESIAEPEAAAHPVPAAQPLAAAAEPLDQGAAARTIPLWEELDADRQEQQCTPTPPADPAALAATSGFTNQAELAAPVEPSTSTTEADLAAPAAPKRPATVRQPNITPLPIERLKQPRHQFIDSADRPGERRDPRADRERIGSSPDPVAARPPAAAPPAPAQQPPRRPHTPVNPVPPGSEDDHAQQLLPMQAQPRRGYQPAPAPRKIMPPLMAVAAGVAAVASILIFMLLPPGPNAVGSDGAGGDAPVSSAPIVAIVPSMTLEATHTASPPSPTAAPAVVNSPIRPTTTVPAPVTTPTSVIPSSVISPSVVPSTALPQATPTPPDLPSAKPEPVPFGTLLQSNGWEYTVEKDSYARYVSEGINNLPPKGRYVHVLVTVRNQSAAGQPIVPGFFVLKDAQGRVYQVQMDASQAFLRRTVNGDYSPNEAIPADGQQHTVVLIFDVEPDAEGFIFLAASKPDQGWAWARIF